MHRGSYILCLDKFAMNMFFGYFVWKEPMKKKGETYRRSPTDFRVFVIEKLANTSFETTATDSLNSSFAGKFDRLTGNLFLRNIPVSEERVYRICKV